MVVKNLGLSKTVERAENAQPRGNYADKSTKSTQAFESNVQAWGGVAATIDRTAMYLMNDNNGAGLNFWDGTQFQGLARYPGRAGTLALTRDLFGVGQSWVDLTGSCRAGVNYKNETGRTICVFVRLGMATTQTTEIRVNGTVAGLWTSSGGNQHTSQGAFAIVPPEAHYSATATQGDSTVLNWSELR